MKNIRNFYLKIFIFLVIKFSVYLNRHVFVMTLSPRIQNGQTKRNRNRSSALERSTARHLGDMLGRLSFLQNIEECVESKY